VIKRFYFVLAVLACIAGRSEDGVTRIAFGSCGHQDKEIPIFNLVAKKRPDLFVFLGDNIYGDTEDMNVLKAKYQKLAAKATFKNLTRSTQIIATWDDHDYGANDAGKYYPLKKESKEIFLDFFAEPSGSERRKHEGIYTSYLWSYGGKTLQIILLDLRTFRSDLIPYDGRLDDDPRYTYEIPYAPHTSPDSTILGEDQWKWLEGELKVSADVRIIGSSSQFGIQYNGYESWANFPLERKRMFGLIKSAKASGVIFISGDVHHAELCKIKSEDNYPIYDLTSSGLTEEWEFATPNRHRIDGPVMENHFGMIVINWNFADPRISLQIWDGENQCRIDHKVRLSEISFVN